MKKVDFMMTAFRDGFQSVFGARVFSQDFLPVVEEAAAAGKCTEKSLRSLHETLFIV